MFVEQLGLLRCTNSHEDSGVVATAARTVERRIIEGSLGCPVCGAEYPIRDGAVWFSADDREPAASMAATAEDATRLAALLALDERAGCYILCGAWGMLARALTDIAPLQLILVSPSPDITGWSALRGAGDAIPLARGSMRGAAIDRESLPLAEAAAQALGANGRLIAPAATPVPAGISVLARDERHWVGERTSSPAITALVTPRRAAPSTGRR